MLVPRGLDQPPSAPAHEPNVPDPAIRLSRLGKRYRTGERSLWSALGLRAPAAKDFWALRDVSFDIAPGEVTGIIGRNGAGKSTLLKLLSRIIQPTEGSAVIRGRVVSLLEVGTGFHPELTGRENVYLNGAILGMSRAEVHAKFDQIVDFAELAEFIDTPVKRYSSGMYTRLAFAVAAHLEPEILIVDEVLAVGDASFQRRCIGRMGEVARHGRTVLFVSHNMGAIAELCHRAVCLESGRVIDDGKPADVIGRYLQTGAAEGMVDLRQHAGDRRHLGPWSLTSIASLDHLGQTTSTFAHGEPIEFAVDITGPAPSEITLGLSIRDESGHVIIHHTSQDTGRPLVLTASPAQLRLRMDQNILNDGVYYVTLFLGDRMANLVDRAGNCLRFTVTSEAQGHSRSRGVVRVPATWSLHTAQPAGAHYG